MKENSISQAVEPNAAPPQSLKYAYCTIPVVEYKIILGGIYLNTLVGPGWQVNDAGAMRHC
jgi:hypothetical protein